MTAEQRVARKLSAAVIVVLGLAGLPQVGAGDRHPLKLAEWATQRERHRPFDDDRLRQPTTCS